ncbi:MAG: transglutaminaseTgpA domain-containing protein, partial [Nocardioides sp.]|nr:transglutaminaseTgpA domain-containing protein [Nocardioides sp.]
MTGIRHGSPLLTAAALAAAAGWTTFLAWRVLTEDFGEVALPLLFLAAVVVAIGAGGRWWGLPSYVTFAAQVVAAGFVVLATTTGSVVPSPANLEAFGTALQQAAESARAHPAPVPTSVPPVHPLLLVAGAALLVVGDLCVALRRAPAVGIPLLVAYVVPLAVTGRGVSWWIFVAAAAAFLALTFVEHAERVGAWGRASDAGDAESFSVRTGAIATSAFALGTATVVTALVLPLGIPTFDVTLFGGGDGEGGPVEVTNPMVDLRRDLNRGLDVTLLEIDTRGEKPSYLRLSVLTRFTDGRWTPGDRDIPSEQTATGDVPGPEGVALSLPRRRSDYEVRVTDNFESAWLPTSANVSAIDAGEQWRYDLSTRDFISVDEDMTSAGQSYRFSGLSFDYDATSMDAATSGASAVRSIFTEVPASVSNDIRRLAATVTAQAPTRFQKAQALQQWFREGGGFRYDISQAESVGGGGADLEAFLDEETGRVGYCEQFAASMAIMARTLGIPARVAVGFLEPRRVGPTTWEYSAWDMHAWPELFFPGSGWVRFEPTPSARTGRAPGYSTTGLEAPTLPTPTPSAAQPSDELPERGGEPAATEADADETSPVPWSVILGALAALAAGALLAVAPRLLRARRRRRRLLGGIEGVWEELRALVVDLGHAWPHGRSPRRAGRVVGGLLAAPSPEGARPDRPRRGRDQAPEAAAAL